MSDNRLEKAREALKLGKRTSSIKTHKMRTEDGTRTVQLTASKAIIYFCTECMGFQQLLVKGCTAKLCPLYPFRTAQIRRKGEEG